MFSVERYSRSRWVVDLAEAIARVVDAGGGRNRVVAQAGGGYVIFRGARGAASVEFEAACGRALGEHDLAPEGQQVLHDRGFRRRTLADSYRRECPLGAERETETLELAAEAAGLLHTLYGLATGAAAELTETAADADPTANPAVIEAMRRLSGARDMPSRIALYHTLVASSLLLAVESDSPVAGARLEPRAVGTMAGLTVCAAFTDEDALLRYEPRGLPYSVVRGSTLFPVLAERPIASLLINPRGEVGGELYRNELVTLRDGVRRLGL